MSVDAFLEDSTCTCSQSVILHSRNFISKMQFLKVECVILRSQSQLVLAPTYQLDLTNNVEGLIYVRSLFWMSEVSARPLKDYKGKTWDCACPGSGPPHVSHQVQTPIPSSLSSSDSLHMRGLLEVLQMFIETLGLQLFRPKPVDERSGFQSARHDVR